jgi:hypothetical protein
MQMSLQDLCVRTLALGGALACLALPTGVLADSGARPNAGDVSAPGSAAVRGIVWNADNAPVPAGKVRLRNLHTGRVEAATVTSDSGQFTFDKIRRGAYLTEVADDSGKVIAVGQSFGLETGETVATFVRLPARRSWFSGAFSNAAAAVIAAASSAGVTAIGSTSPPVSPQ